MSEQGIEKLQFGIDLGRVLGSIKEVRTSDEAGVAAQKIVDVLELGLKVDDEPSLLLGLGFGLSSRHATRLDADALQLMAMVAQKQEESKEV